MNKFSHFCPWCGTTLGINEIEDESTASRCPSCNNIVIIKEHGAKLSKAYSYTCPKCGELHVYGERPPYVVCEKCGSIYQTSEHGQCMIDISLCQRGEKGELPFNKKPDYWIQVQNRWRFLPVKIKMSIFAMLAVLILLSTFLYIKSLPADIETTKAYASMENVWKEFREKNPYNIQIEGIKKFDDNSYIAILSEPNEQKSEEDILKFFEKYNCSVKSFTKSIGYDGWLKDAVVAFNDIDESDIPELSAELSKFLYKTDYKAAFLNLDTIPQHTAFSEHNLNLSVTEEELRKWLIDDDATVFPIRDEKNKCKFVELFNDYKENKNHLYLSEQTGLVIWFVERGMISHETFGVEAREFSIDSDLVLGAIANEKVVAIIGRERCVPIYELPPMRVETLSLLASTSEDELAQSYERLNVFAGKLNGGKDFAPILLSERLWHTEYGSLLNITDQMLKSWSENGMVDYVDFDYPKPVNRAFDKGVVGDLNASELTYNWNTDGVGYIVDDDVYSIYAINRTGSLPVSYIPGDATQISEHDKVYQAEQNAYDFFSNLASPELAKVVQYAGMYQIFKNFEISLSDYDNPTYPYVVPDKLKDISYDMLTKVVNYDESTKQQITKHFRQRIEKSNSIIEKLSLMFYSRELETTMDTLSQVLGKVSRDDTFLRCAANSLVDRNAEIEYSSSDPIAPSVLFVNINKTSKEDRVRNVLYYLNKNQQHLQSFVEICFDNKKETYRDIYVSDNKDNSSNWIKCPTIVESWHTKDSTIVTGGHNLNSKITKFRVAKDLKPGETRILEENGRKVIEISVSNRKSHVGNSTYLRRVGRLDKADMTETKVPVRSQNVALRETANRTSRGFNESDHLRIRFMSDNKFSINGKNYASLEDVFQAIEMKFEHGDAPVKSVEFEGLKDAGVNVDVIINGVQCRLRRGNCSAVKMANYDFAHKTVMYDGDMAIVTIPIKTGAVEFGSTSQVNQAGLGGSTNTTSSIQIKNGKTVFRVYKEKLGSLMKALDEFFASKTTYFNEFKLMQILRKYGLVPSEVHQKTILNPDIETQMKHIQVAKVYLNNRGIYVFSIQEENIA